MVTNEERMDTIFEGMCFVIDACEKIRDAGRCDECPVWCIEQDSFYEMGDCVSKGKWLEFFALAEDTENFITEADYIADLADRERKEDRDEWYD